MAGSGPAYIYQVGLYYYTIIGISETEMQKVGDTGDVSLLFFLAGANFWAILGHLWAMLAILGHFRAILGNFVSFWAILGHFWAIFWC